MQLNYQTKKGFGSDNHSGVHPLLMEALQSANAGHQPSYGTDAISQQATELFQEKFDTQCPVYFVYNGTAANVLALRSITDSFHSVIVAASSHLNIDECAAPEVVGHCKLIPLTPRFGKLNPDEVRSQLRRWGDQHFAQPKVISITQPTESGTLYQPDEIKELATIAHANNMWLHMDGARFIVAAQALKLSFAEMTTNLGVDVVSFGGTKNGLMFGEALLFLNPACHHGGVKFFRKQLLQLPSKSRFIACQFLALLEKDLWKSVAQHELNCAQRMLEGLKQIPSIEISYPVESNAVFARLPRNIIHNLRKDYFFYVWDENQNEVRLMMSFDTQFEEIDRFCQCASQLLATNEAERPKRGTNL